jgi:hypothetical protein
MKLRGPLFKEKITTTFDKKQGANIAGPNNTVALQIV